MAAPEFPVNTHRFDPYKNFKFRVKWDGKYVAGVSKISALKRSTVPVVYRSGSDPSQSRISPGSWLFEPITLERGVTHDLEFEKWANLSFSIQGDAAMSLKNFRKDIIIELLNEQGSVAKAFKVYRCWVSEYQVLPDLDSNGGVTAIESIVLQNEGWERDAEVPEPAEH
jgi:phage tail-like protein